LFLNLVMLASAIAFVIRLIVDVVVSVFRVPVRVAHLVFLVHIGLGTPHFSAAVGVLLGRERSSILGNVHLIFCHGEVETRVHLVFEESVGHTEIVIGVNTNGQIAGNGIPRVLMQFPNRSITPVHHGHFIIDTSRPEDFNFLTFGVSHNLTQDVGLIGFIENIDTVVHNEVSVIDFFVRGKTHSLDFKDLTAGDTWHTTHNFFSISRLGAVVPWDAHLSIQLLNVFHSPGSIVCGNGARLTNGVDVPHVVNWRRRAAVISLQICINVLG